MNESYVSLGIHNLLTIGDGVVNPHGNIVLFDNLDRDSARDPDIAIPFQNTLMKLEFSIMILCMKGHLSFSIDFKWIDICPGDVIFLRRGQIAEFHEASENCSLILMASAEEFLDLSEYHDVAFESLGTSPESVKFQPSAPLFAEMVGIYRIMKSKLSDTEFRFRNQVVKACVGMLIADIFQLSLSAVNAADRSEKSNQEVTERQIAIYRGFIKLVKENFHRERTVEYYAGRLCISINYLSRVVRKVGGRSVGEWIRDYVILEAKALLGSGNIPVGQISEMLNFPSPSFFSRYFRENTGMTPSAYRKS